MVHIDKHGRIVTQRPWSARLVLEWLWALVNAFYLFFATFFRTDLDHRGSVKNNNWRAAAPPRSTRPYGSGGGATIRTTQDLKDCAPGTA